jgi:hypothetical protein
MESVQTLAKATRIAPAAVITRTPVFPALKALHFAGWEQVRAQLGIADFEAQVVVADLYLGAWKGHWIAYELQKQLRLPENRLVQPLLNDGDYADTVGKLIDNESEGDKNFKLCLHNCQSIKQALLEQDISFVLLIPPQKECAWEDENIAMLKLLQESLIDTTISICLLLPVGTALNIPQEWTLDYLNLPAETATPTRTLPYLPGIVNQATARQLGADAENSIKITNNFYALSPLARSDKPEESAPASLWNKDSHLAVARQLHSASITDGELIEREALRRFAEGAYGIALRLLAGLLPKVEGLKREYIRVQIQNIRIALLDFAAAAQEEAPADDLPDLLKASLNQSKAWGLVMSNRPADAEPFFAKAMTFLNKETFPRLYLYLLNITALNQLRLGNIDAAFLLEKEIEATLDKQSVRDWHVTYINNINQARLFKKANNLEEAESYYNRAFAINSQLKNESDLLYTNLCFAQLEELKCNYEKSFIFWLRTCLHWLSNDAPESLAPRVAQAILHKNLSGSTRGVEEISQQLCNELLAAAARIGLEASSATRVITFARPETTAIIPDLAIGQAGWGVCLATDKVPARYNGPYYNHLSGCLFGCLHSLFPKVRWNDFNTIITDTQVFRELPSSPTELLLVALRLQVSQLVFNNKAFAISNDEREKLIRQVKISISPAINFVLYEAERMKAFFRRYLPPLVLSKAETEFMQRLQRNPNYTIAEAGEIDLIYQMEQSRLIQLTL